MIKQKGLKAIVISLLIILSASCFSLLYSSAYKTFTKESPQAASAYDFANGTVTSDDYDEYTIGNLVALKNFATSVSNSRLNFLNKRVILTSNIDCEGESIVIGGTGQLTQYGPYQNSVFAGTFDGKGNTISNFKLGSDAISVGGYSISGNTTGQKARGLFLELTGTIQNLHLKSVSTDSGVSGGYGGVTTIFQAAMVGCFHGGVISNCVVEDFSGASYASGIVAACFSGEITNCCVSGITNAGLVGYGIGPSAEKVYTNNSASQYKYFDCDISNCISKDLDASILSSTNCYSSNTGDKFENLESIGSEGGTSGTTWYYGGNDYNDGWPMLRVFIKNWQTIKAQSASNYGGLEINGKTSVAISIPAEVDFASSYTPNGKYSGMEGIEICEQSLIATVIDPCYQLDYWLYSSTSTDTNHEFYVYVAQKTFNISFASVEGTTNDSKSSYTINCPTGVKLIIKSEEEVQFKFTDSAGTTHYVTYSIDASTHNGYKISSTNLLETFENDGYRLLHTHDDSPKTIDVGISLKEYEITFDDADYVSHNASNPYTVYHGETIKVTQSQTECSYTFKCVGSTTDTTVKYTINDSSIYKITNANWKNNDPVTSINTFKPSTEQYAIYVQFASTTGDYTSSPSRTDQFTIEYTKSSDPNYTITNTMPDNGTENKTLTYTLNETTEVTYTVPAIYVLEDVGINKTTTKITINPKLKEKYTIVEFKINDCGTITSSESILIDLNTLVVDNGWNGSIKKFKYTKDGDSNKNIDIDLSSYLTNTKYYKEFKQEADEDKQKATLIIVLKSYTITFG